MIKDEIEVRGNNWVYTEKGKAFKCADKPDVEKERIQSRYAGEECEIDYHCFSHNANVWENKCVGKNVKVLKTEKLQIKPINVL